MRFRMRDLLMVNAVGAIYLTACVYALKGAESNLPPTASISQIANSAISTSLIGLAVLVSLMEATRRFRLRRLSPIIAVLPVPMSWSFPLSYAGVLLIISFFATQYVGASPGLAFVFVISGMYSLFGMLVLTVIHPDATICNAGVFHSVYLIPWERVSVVRNTGGEIQMLRCGWKINGGFSAEVPPELRPSIEDLLRARHK